ncbi:MAG: hypothetical protein JWN51_295 [Phycisphaerales bacterium]|nr:hypothetical protein [Phycisphaerales bacterium]
MRLGYDLPSRLSRFLFIVLMCMAWTGAVGGPPVSPAANTPSAGTRPEAAAPPQPDPTPEALNEAADHFDKVFAAIESCRREMPRDSFDPQAVVASVGRDTPALFTWVRDRTDWVPYLGMLRGPKGVLMDRVGNSLDRALLLATLVEGTGQTVRLAHGTMGKAQAAALLTKLFSVAPHARPASALEKPGDAASARQLVAARYAANFGTDPDEFLAGVSRAELGVQRACEQSVQSAAEQWPVIAKAVGTPRAPDPAERDAPALESLADHWWVQAKPKNAAWMDLDPTVPDALPAAAPLAVADRFVDPDAAGRFPIEQELRHRIVVRVIIERWAGGTLKTEPVLEHSLYPSETGGDPIVLRQVPVKFADPQKVKREKDPDGRLRVAGTNATEWLPVIRIGSRQVTQNSFTDAGQVSTATQEDPAAKVGQGVRSGFGGFGALNGQDSKPAADSVLTAEWVEYEIISPGAPKTTTRREVFDLLGSQKRTPAPAQRPEVREPDRLRRGLAIMTEIEMMPLACRPSDEFVAQVTAQRLLARGADLVRRYRAAAIAMAAQKKAGAKVALPVGEPAVADAVMTEGLLYLATARHAWSRHADEIFIDRPNLFTYRTSVNLNPAGELSFRLGFDIVANDVAVRPAAAGNPFLVRLEQGVLDTNIERYLMDALGPVQNTAALFEGAQRRGVEWNAVRAAASPALRDAPGYVRTSVEEDLSAGYAVLLSPAGGTPDPAGSVGWWRVNPVTGQTLGRMDHGEGQAMTEDVVIKYLVTLVPSLSATALSQYCKHYGGGSTSGKCNPCLHMALGLFGAVMGFAYAAAAGSLGYLLSGATGTYGFATRVGPCFDKLFPGVLPG